MTTFKLISYFIVCLLVLTTIFNHVAGKKINCDEAITKMDKCNAELLFTDGRFPTNVDFMNNDYCRQLDRRLKCVVGPRSCLTSKFELKIHRM